MERILEASGTNRLQKVLAALWPQPDSGNFLLDVFHVFLLAAIEQSMIPHQMLGVFRIDILTPWLFVFFVFAPLRKSLPLAILAGLIQETRSTAPAGMYMSAYWSAAVTLHFIRHTLSWRHVGPWNVMLASCMAWVISFETLVIAVTQDPGRLGWKYGFSQIFRILIAIAIGVFFARTAKNRLPPEDQVG